MDVAERFWWPVREPGRFVPYLMRLLDNLGELAYMCNCMLSLAHKSCFVNYFCACTCGVILSLLDTLLDTKLLHVHKRHVPAASSLVKTQPKNLLCSNCKNVSDYWYSSRTKNHVFPTFNKLVIRMIFYCCPVFKLNAYFSNDTSILLIITI